TRSAVHRRRQRIPKIHTISTSRIAICPHAVNDFISQHLCLRLQQRFLTELQRTGLQSHQSQNANRQDQHRDQNFDQAHALLCFNCHGGRLNQHEKSVPPLSS